MSSQSIWGHRQNVAIVRRSLPGVPRLPKQKLITSIARLPFDSSWLRSFCITTGLAVALMCCSGCQTFAPFSQSMRTRVAAARQWTGNGIDAIRRGAVGEARACFSKASSQLPTDHHIIANVARTHYQEGQFEQAIEEMNRAIRIEDEEPELYVELGEYHLAAGNLQEATALAEKCLDRNHRLAPAWLLKGKVHAARGDHQTALCDFQKAIGIDASSDEAQLQIVQAYRKLGDPLRALSAVEKLLEKYPTGQQPELALIEKSTALLELKQNRTAIENLQSAISGNSGSQQLNVALAQAQELSGSQLDSADGTMRR